MALIEVRELTKTYTKGDSVIEPLKNVSLDIEQGELISLMGASGTGKSTLLNLIAGIDAPDSGEISVAGTVITGLSTSRLTRWRADNIGYIFS